MDKERLKRLAQEERFIPGIYNYCDRWCERCSFTSRCLNYAMGEEEWKDPESRDISNAAFWERMAETLRTAMELLGEMAEREGIDLDSLDLQTEPATRFDSQDVRNHPCCLGAKLYAEMVSDFLDSPGDGILRLEEEFHLAGLADTGGPDPGALGVREVDALEVLRFYQHQIHVKLIRAVHGKLDAIRELDEGFPKDSDGSAKVALIDMDRSIAAWGNIRDGFPRFAGEVLGFMTHLERLRRQVERNFPNARAFVRPGFDTEAVAG